MNSKPKRKNKAKPHSNWDQKKEYYKMKKETTKNK